MNDIEAITFSQDDNSSQEQGTIEGDFVKVTFEGNTYQEPMPFYLQASQAVIVLAAFVLISILGSLATVIRVAKIDPARIIGGDFQ